MVVRGRVGGGGAWRRLVEADEVDAGAGVGAGEWRRGLGGNGWVKADELKALWCEVGVRRWVGS